MYYVLYIYLFIFFCKVLYFDFLKCVYYVVVKERIWRKYDDQWNIEKKKYLFVFFNWLNCVKFYWYGREMCNVVENC